ESYSLVLLSRHLKRYGIRPCEKLHQPDWSGKCRSKCHEQRGTHNSVRARRPEYLGKVAYNPSLINHESLLLKACLLIFFLQIMNIEGCTYLGPNTRTGFGFFRTLLNALEKFFLLSIAFGGAFIAPSNQ